MTDRTLSIEDLNITKITVTPILSEDYKKADVTICLLDWIEITGIQIHKNPMGHHYVDYGDQLKPFGAGIRVQLQNKILQEYAWWFGQGTCD